METKIKYTESGKKEIDSFLTEQKHLIENFLIHEKYIMGDEEIEITGSDIIKIKQDMDIVFKKSPYLKSSSLKMISYLYVFLGIVMTAFGLGYGYLRELLQTNKEQAMIIIMGLTISVFGTLVLGFVKFREKRKKDIEIYQRLIDEIMERNIRNG